MRIQQITSRLSASRLRRIRRKLEEIDEILLEETDEKGELYTVTHAFYPASTPR